MCQQEDSAKNVLGEPLQSCCLDPPTGFYRTGSCDTGPEDAGAHVICAQVTQALTNMAGLLESEGASLSDVVKTTVFLVDMDDYAEMNRIYMEEFGDHRPARSAVAVAQLPIGARVEIEAIASV